MGLDQYAGIRETTTEFEWRKHAKLQEFMEKIWYQQEGSVDAFNCKDLILNKEIIEELQKCIETNTMPASPGGFFYGHQFQDEQADEYKEKDLRFCKWALKAIEDGQQVYYTCWW